MEIIKMRSLQVKALLRGEKNLAILLQDEDTGDLVPLWVDLSEAVAITYELQGKRFPRPLGCDLLDSILTELNLFLKKVKLTGMEEGIGNARIFLGEEGQQIRGFDCGPSDAIILALKEEVPIYITEELFQKLYIPSTFEEGVQFEKFVEEELDLRLFKRFRNED